MPGARESHFVRSRLPVPHLPGATTFERRCTGVPQQGLADMNIHDALLRSEPTREEMVESIESLILSLPGVLSAHVEERPRGEVDLIRVHASGGVPRDRIYHAIKSALLIYLDLEISKNQISITETDEHVGAETTESGNGTSADPSASISPKGSAASPTGINDDSWRTMAKQAPSELPGMDPTPDSHARQQLETGKAPGSPETEGTSHAAHTWKPAAPMKFAGYRIDGGSASGVEVLVSVDIDGNRFGGLVPVPKLTSVTPKVFAQAATIAACKAINQEISDPGARRIRLKMQEIGKVEALGRLHLAVTISETGDGGERTATGFAAVGQDPPRVAAMAAIDAVRRLFGSY